MWNEMKSPVSWIPILWAVTPKTGRPCRLQTLQTATVQTEYFFLTHLIHFFRRVLQLQKKNVKPWSQAWLITAGAYPGFCSMKRLEVFLLPLDGMLVHRRSLPRNFVRFPQQFAGTHLYTWVERGTVRVKCLAQEHNTMSPARARTRTARSGD